MSDPDSEKDVEMVRKHVDALAEHFDSVHIFATRCETGELDGTITVQMGAGNWYSRYGQISEWMIKEDERARKKERDPDPED